MGRYRWDGTGYLHVGVLETALYDAGTHRYRESVRQINSRPLKIFDLKLGFDDFPPSRCIVEVEVTKTGSVGGAALWFEPELDDGLVLSNAPGRLGHWNQLVCEWSSQHSVERGARFALEVICLANRSLIVRPAPIA